MIEAHGIKLGPLNEKVLPLLYDWRNNADLYKNFRQYRPITMEEHIEWFRSLHKNDKIRMFIVGINDTIIGVAGLTSIDRVNSRAELSLYVIDQHQDKLRDAFWTLIEYAFEKENLNSVFADVFEHDIKKHEIMNELTCHKARITQSYFRDGKYIDSIIYTILRP